MTDDNTPANHLDPERYTPELRRVYRIAMDAARDRAHYYITTEHLLFGLVIANTSVRDYLLRIGVRLQILEELTCRLRQWANTQPTEPIRLSAQVKVALSEANFGSGGMMGAEDLLLALAANRMCSAETILTKFGVTHEKVRNAFTQPTLREKAEDNPGAILGNATYSNSTSFYIPQVNAVWVKNTQGAVMNDEKDTLLNDLLENAVEQMPPLRKRVYRRRLKNDAFRAAVLDELELKLVETEGMVLALSSQQISPETWKQLLDLVIKYLPLIIEIVLKFL